MYTEWRQRQSRKNRAMCRRTSSRHTSIGVTAAAQDSQSQRHHHQRVLQRGPRHHAWARGASRPQMRKSEGYVGERIVLIRTLVSLPR